MFKLVVLSVFLAAAVAEPEPGVLLSSPWAGYSSYVSPATSYIRTAGSVVHPSSIVYSAPGAYTHFIKKRSPQIPLGFIAPTTYLTSGHIVSPAFTTPLLPATSVLPAAPVTYTAAHLIKKRSLGLYGSPLIAPTTYTAAAAPLLTTTYAAGSPFISSPLLSHPFAYSTHLIKKRSAQFLPTYVAPTSYSHTSRIDVNHATPLIYSSAYAYPRVFGNSVVIAK